MEPFGATIFCDDIRFETYAKISLIGVYGYEMVVVGSFPISLPKLGMLVLVRFHKTQTVPTAKMLIYYPGDAEDAPSHTQEIPTQLDAAQFPWPDPSVYPDPSEFYGVNCPLLFSPVVIRQPGYIRVRVLGGDARVKAGSLKIREATPQEVAQITGTAIP